MVQVRLRWQLFPLRWRTVIVSENPAPSPMLQADNGFTAERRVLLRERFPATISLFELAPARAGSSIREEAASQGGHDQEVNRERLIRQRWRRSLHPRAQRRPPDSCREPA